MRRFAIALFPLTALLSLARCVSDSTDGPKQDSGVTDGGGTDGTTGDGMTGTDAPDGSGPTSWHIVASGPSHATSIMVDDTGAIFVAGYFSGTMKYEGGSVTATGEDGFLMRVDPVTHKPTWVTVIGGYQDAGPADDRVLAIVSDKAGGIFLTATIGSSKVTLGPTTLKFAHGPQYHSSLVARVDASNGDVLWATTLDEQRQQLDYYSDCYGLDVQMNQLVLACTYSRANFGPQGSQLEPPINQAAVGVFHGGFQMGGLSIDWGIALSGAASAFGSNAAFAPNGDVYVAGAINNAQTSSGLQYFDNNSKQWLNAGGASYTGQVGFAARMTYKGMIPDVATWGGGGGQLAVRELSVAGGSVMVGGYYNGTVNFGKGPMTAMMQNGFVLNLASTLSTTWQLDIGGVAFEDVSGTVFTPTGAIISGGYTKGFKVGSTTLPDSSGSSVFLGRVDNTGTVTGATSIDSTGFVVIDALAVDAKAKAVYGAGTHTGTVTFEDGTKISAAAEALLLIRRDL